LEISRHGSEWGLQLRTNEYKFVAPSSGYQESDEVDLPAGSPNWSNVCERKYFVKLVGGKYGRITLSVNALGSFQVQGHVNPSGSQNLEFDPSKRIKSDDPQ